jgi:Cdc6-like AAA superfamily ATPase
MDGILEHAHLHDDDEPGRLPVVSAVALLDDDPYAPRPGRPLDFPREIIELCLFEVAAQAGNARKAHDVLRRRAEGLWEPPSADTLYRWIRGRFRNRYHEISQQATEGLRELMAQQATERALEAAEVEREALRQVMAQLADADAVQASIILRNLTTSKGINIDQEGRLRGRANVIVDHGDFGDLLKELVKVGVARHIGDDVVDGEVVG